MKNLPDITNIHIEKLLNGQGTDIFYKFEGKECMYFTKQDVTERVAEIILDHLTEEQHKKNILWKN